MAAVEIPKEFRTGKMGRRVYLDRYTGTDKVVVLPDGISTVGNIWTDDNRDIVETIVIPKNC